MELVPAQCQNCGAQLQIDPASDEIECPFCGTAYAVRMSGRTIGLRRVTESLGRIDQSTSLAVRQLHFEILPPPEGEK